MSITLLYAPVSCSLVPFLTLTEAGADFEVRPVNNGKAQNRSSEFLGINPKGKVPVLLIDGKPLTENVAIQIWIARQFPAAQLLPSAPEDEIQAISLMAWFASGVHPHITPINRTKRYCDLPGAEENVRNLAKQALLEDMIIANERLAGRTWFFDHFTAPDAYFFWCFRRAVSLKLDLDGLQNCFRHFDAMSQRDSVKKAVAFEKQVIEEFDQAA